MLLYEPDFKGWGNKIARHFRLVNIDDSTKESLEELEEFDEEWEQVLYRACARNYYLSSRVFSLSRLLTIIGDFVSKDAIFEAEVERIMGLASVTTISTADTESQKRSRSPLKRLDSIEEFLETQRKEGVEERILEIWTVIITEIKSIFGESIRFDMTTSGITVIVLRNKSRERKLVRLDSRTNSVSINADKFGTYSVRTLESGDKYSLPEKFYGYLCTRFRKISLGKIPNPPSISVN